MFLPSLYLELFLHVSEPFNDAGDNCRRLVGHLQIVHVPLYYHLVPIGGLIGHTWVVWVYFEALGV